MLGLDTSIGQCPFSSEMISVYVCMEDVLAMVMAPRVITDTSVSLTLGKAHDRGLRPRGGSSQPAGCHAQASSIPGPHPPVPLFLAFLPSQPLAPLWEPLPPFGPVSLRWPLITVCPPEMLGPAQGRMGSFSPSFLVFYKLGNPLETEP